ncbi:hypothetical protein KP509_01G124700 [Ceratopteris richardii]|nr:hypothetical protein KP509_01G124700 [Ceratopteris richardii]
MLKECIKEKDHNRGAQIHAEHIWTELHDQGTKDLLCFQRMKSEGLLPNLITFYNILKACIASHAIHSGQQIHVELAEQDFLEKDMVICNAILYMYTKFGLLKEAQDVFDKLPMQDVVSWNTLILGYAQQGHVYEALISFENMQHAGHAPNAITFLSILKACAHAGNPKKGEEIHTQITTRGLFEGDATIGSALVDMYAKCGSLVKAQRVFDDILEKNLISWTALINGYVKHGYAQEALGCFKCMQLAGHCPNTVTFICLLKACGSIKASNDGLKLHSQIVKQGSFETAPSLGTALMNMYFSCSMLLDAQNVFHQLEVQDRISWNALMHGYVQNSLEEYAMLCLEKMQSNGFPPNAVTFVCILKASARLGTACKGQQLHAEIIKYELPENPVIDSALIDMYMNCGMFAEAQVVFDKVAIHNTSLWNVLIAGYGQVGKNHVVFGLLKKLLDVGIIPDQSLYSILLNTCSHTGLLDTAQFYFEAMSTNGVIPTQEHYTCMIDLYGRAGLLEEARLILENMPFLANRLVWRILLTASYKQRSIDLGWEAIEHAAQLDKINSAARVCIRNMYAAIKSDYILAGEIHSLKDLQ